MQNITEINFAALRVKRYCGKWFGGGGGHCHGQASLVEGGRTLISAYKGHRLTAFSRPSNCSYSRQYRSRGTISQNLITYVCELTMSLQQT
jgi:hypothetical protein